MVLHFPALKEAFEPPDSPSLHIGKKFMCSVSAVGLGSPVLYCPRLVPLLVQSLDRLYLTGNTDITFAVSLPWRNDLWWHLLRRHVSLALVARRISKDMLQLGYTGLDKWLLICTVTNYCIWINADFRFTDYVWMCSVMLMNQVSRALITAWHGNTRVSWVLLYQRQSLHLVFDWKCLSTCISLCIAGASTISQTLSLNPPYYLQHLPLLLYY